MAQWWGSTLESKKFTHFCSCQLCDLAAPAVFMLVGIMCLASSCLSDNRVFFSPWACDATRQLLRKALLGKLQKAQTDLWNMMKWIVLWGQIRAGSEIMMFWGCCMFLSAIMLNCFTSWSPVKNFLGPDPFTSYIHTHAFRLSCYLKGVKISYSYKLNVQHISFMASNQTVLNCITSIG